MNTFNLQHGGLGAIDLLSTFNTVNQITSAQEKPKLFDQILNTVTKVGTAAGTIKSSFTQPKTTTPINTTGINAGYSPAPTEPVGPNYLKIGLIALAVGVAGVVGYKALK
jgi:hypothetical protein